MSLLTFSLGSTYPEIGGLSCAKKPQFCITLLGVVSAICGCGLQPVKGFANM